MRRERGIAWNWAEACRGALCALPGAAILLAGDIGLGMCFALGTLLVAMLGVPPRRSRRPRLGLIGLSFALAYSLGSVLGLSAIAAVAALTVLAYAGVLFSARKPAARLLPAFLLPGLALGMNHPAPDGFAFAAVLLAGSAWATLVTYAWPQTSSPAVTATNPRQAPDPERARRDARIYAILFAVAAGTALAIGYLLELTHVAWAAAAAMFIMRPDPGLLASRAVGRTIATFAGVVAAGLVLRRGPTEIALAIVTVTAISAMVAVRSSRWYVAPAGSTVIVLLLSGVASKEAFAISFDERLLETAIGAALALALGVAVPAWMRRPAGSNPGS